MRGLLSALAVALSSSPALAACSIVRIAELPVTMAGLRPTVTAGVNGRDETFIADSGAFFSVISPGTASDLGLKLGPAPYGMWMVGVGGNADAQVATVKSFAIAGATLPNVQLIVGGSEVGTAGVLGQNLLGLADVEYDLPHGAIRLMRTKDCQRTNLAYWVKPDEDYAIVAIDDRRASGGHTAGMVRINETTLRAVFDTGAETTIVSLRAAARAGLKPDMPGATAGGFQHGFGRKPVATWIVPVKLIDIGGEQIRNARIRIGDIGAITDMLIGADFFISHRVFVSNALHKLFFSYTGGPIFDLTAHWAGDGGASTPADGAAEPALDAEALARRGAVEAAQHDEARAITDLSQAITLAPGEPRYLLQRAALYLDTDRSAPAATDIDAAIRLKGDDVDARMLRARLRLKQKDMSGTIEDVDAAAAASGKADDRRLAMAWMYIDAGALDQAIAQASLWIVNHPIDVKRPEALNTRCWARALSGTELPLALADCDAALRLRPGAAGILDSRGLVHLRMGDRDKALADYGRALAINPRIAWSLYGRGLVERAAGQAEPAKADMAAAIAIDPALPALARHYTIGD